MQKFAATVVRLRDLTHDVRELELRLDAPSSIVFDAGQFVSFQVPVSHLAFPLTRPYSIASPSSVRSSVTLLFNFVPGGPGSTFLYDLQPGNAVQFSGPAGTFTLRDAPDRDLLLVATATGIAPLRSILLTRLEQPGKGRIQLIWGLRSERDLFLSGGTEGARQSAPAVLVRHNAVAAVESVERRKGARAAGGRTAGAVGGGALGVSMRQQRHDQERHRHHQAQGSVPDSPRTVYRDREPGGEI